MKQRFFICKHCGNLIAMVKDTGVPVVCCGEKMHELIPGTTDASVEKHVPVYAVEGSTVHVKVGEAEHPMLPEHYIEWISIQTKQGNQRKSCIPARSRKPASPCARETRWRRPMPTATSTVSGKNNSHIERKPLHIRAERCSCFQNGPIKNSEW